MLPLSPAPDLLGIDIGGTAIKLGRFDPQGTLLAELDVPTPPPQVPGAVCQAVVEAVAALDPERWENKMPSRRCIPPR
jgi:glucokinase